MKKIIALVLALILAMSMAACGGETASTPVKETGLAQSATGRYEIEKITWEDGTEATGDLLTVVGDCYIELYSDNTALLCLYGVRMEMEFDDNSMWRVGSSFSDYDFSVKDGRATLVDADTTFIFVKN